MISLHRLGLPVTLAALATLFSWISPSFLTTANLHGIIMNHAALLTLAALAMTLVVAAGGIDLSIGTAIDMAGFAYIASLAAGQPPALAIGAGLVAGLAVGGFNAFLIAQIRIPPFLATLGTLFIGHSIQQLATGGGVPIYLIAGPPRPIFGLVDAARPWISLSAAAVVFVVLSLSAYGRRLSVLGISPAVALFSGLPVRRDLAVVMLSSAALTALAGIALSSGVHSYSPLSGNAYLMDAIGATFLGTTFHPNRRANVVGTLLGVLLLSIVKNGLLLAGVSFYWQQVANGVLIFTVLAVSFAKQRHAGIANPA